MDAYTSEETDEFRQGVRHSLEHDVPKAREALAAVMNTIISDDYLDPRLFHTGRRYAVGKALEAFEVAIAKVEAEIRQQSAP